MKKSSLGLGRYISSQRNPLPYALCQKCGRPVDYEEIVEGRPGESETAQVLVRHHGEEELCEMGFGTKYWDWAQLGRFITAHQWFRPEQEG